MYCTVCLEDDQAEEASMCSKKSRLSNLAGNSVQRWKE